MIELDKVEVVMEGGSCGPELQVVVMEDGPFYYADEVDKYIKALGAERDKLEDKVATLEEQHTTDINTMDIQSNHVSELQEDVALALASNDALMTEVKILTARLGIEQVKLLKQKKIRGELEQRINELEAELAAKDKYIASMIEGAESLLIENRDLKLAINARRSHSR